MLVDSEYLGNVSLEMKLAEQGAQVSTDTLTEKYRGWKLATIFEELETAYEVKLYGLFTHIVSVL